MVVGFTTVKDVAGISPKDTAVAELKFVPVIVTVCPTPAEVGENDVTVGTCAKAIKPIKNIKIDVITEFLPVFEEELELLQQLSAKKLLNVKSLIISVFDFLLNGSN
jgi:hypothetical protein